MLKAQGTPWEPQAKPVLAWRVPVLVPLPLPVRVLELVLVLVRVLVLVLVQKWVLEPVL